MFPPLPCRPLFLSSPATTRALLLSSTTLVSSRIRLSSTALPNHEQTPRDEEGEEDIEEDENSDNPTTSTPLSFLSPRRGENNRNDESTDLLQSLGYQSQEKEGGEQENEQQQQQNVLLPTTGISLSDEMEMAQQQQESAFVTYVLPVEDGLPPGVVAPAAQLVTDPIDPQVVAFEPLRYLVALDPPPPPTTTTSKTIPKASQRSTPPRCCLFAMVDVPPFSLDLVTQMKEFMQKYNHEYLQYHQQQRQQEQGQQTEQQQQQIQANGTWMESPSSLSPSSWLVAILVTSSDAIYVEESPTQLYSQTRRVELLQQWQQAFPQALVVMDRLETPRECARAMTATSKSSSSSLPLPLQRLDGQGPFGWNSTRRQFEELGKPLRVQEWDWVTEQRIRNGTLRPEDIPILPATISTTPMSNSTTTNNNDKKSNNNGIEMSEYSREMIRAREQGCPILAIRTPGHSFGSLSYVFPQVGVCASGYTLPVEDEQRTGNEKDWSPSSSSSSFSSVASSSSSSSVSMGGGGGDGGGGGPALDVRGYITTSRAGIRQQMKSARQLVQDYVDRFYIILPSRGSLMVLRPNDNIPDDSSSVADQALSSPASAAAASSSSSSSSSSLFVVQERQAILLAMIDMYDQIGQIYEQLGITS